MTGHRAYYSLIQYCPDRSRAEAANIGVVLVCPELEFIRARTVGNNQRVKRFFGASAIDSKRFRLVERAIEARIANHYDWSSGVADLERFISTRANDIQLTPHRSMKSTNPEADLEQLFEELVLERTDALARVRPDRPQPAEVDRVFAYLDNEFRAPRFQGRIRFNELVEIPVLGKQLEVEYAFDNGAENLIKTMTFRGREETILRDATELAVEGDLLSRHAGPRSRQLIVLPVFTAKPGDAPARVGQLFSEYNVRLVEPEQVAAFVQEVAERAH